MTVPALVAVAAKRKAAVEARNHGPKILATIGAVLAVVVGLPVMAIIIAIAGTPASGASGVFAGDIPPVAVTAYHQGAAHCPGLDWTVLAGIGRVESDHGRIFGGQVLETGDVDPPIVGIALNGANNTQAIRVPPGGSLWHDDPVWDHATGPMQFITGTWATSGVDGNGDGIASPHNLYDATIAAARYLCAGRPELGDLRAALFTYNRSRDYVDAVLAWAATYQSATGPVAVAGGDVPLANVRGITVHAQLAPQLATLLAHAEADGIVLSGWGWRSPERTAELRRINGCPDIYTSPPSTCRVPTAIPGTSMHERGLAIDFTTGGSAIGSRNTEAFQWLAAHAARYGLFNLESEPWHWSTTGG